MITETTKIVEMSTLTDEQITFFLGKILGINIIVKNFGKLCYLCIGEDGLKNSSWLRYKPTEMWTHGGPLIEQYKISLEFEEGEEKIWMAYMNGDENSTTSGVIVRHKKPLKAAMLCLLQYKTGTSKVNTDDFKEFEDIKI